MDIVVGLPGSTFSSLTAGRRYADLGRELGMSTSEVHAAVRRLGDASLIGSGTKEVRREPQRNFLLHGVPYAFPARPKEVTQGLPTAWAAPALYALLALVDAVRIGWAREPALAPATPPPISRCYAASSRSGGVGFTPIFAAPPSSCAINVVSLLPFVSYLNHLPPCSEEPCTPASACITPVGYACFVK
ncbi:MAG: AsnC family protein [Opitutaceae bacterium]|nr:AsnC family protein [Opitutaceae bacterium]